MKSSAPKAPDANDLADQAETIGAKDEPLASPISDGDIPLPPEELRDQLDNSKDDATEEQPEVATLDFFGDELPEWTHPLRFKFRWQGTSYEAITVRQLNVADVGAVYAKASAENRVPVVFDFYAEMTGLPAPVLRALKSVDGGPVTEKCWDFLPPSVRGAPD